MRKMGEFIGMKVSDDVHQYKKYKKSPAGSLKQFFMFDGHRGLY